jgi:hypothetical protein
MLSKLFFQIVDLLAEALQLVKAVCEVTRLPRTRFD